MKSLVALLALVGIAGMGCGDRGVVAPDPLTTPETLDAPRPVGVAFNGVFTTALDLSAAKIWIDDENVQHVRGAKAHYTIDGEAAACSFTGNGTGLVDWDIQLDSGDGVVSAQESHSCVWGENTGSFGGVSECAVVGWQIIGRCGWSGEGDFAQMQFLGSFEGPWTAKAKEMVAIISGACPEALP
jgi:hypothetical protein